MSGAQGSDSRCLSGLRVLVVEDEPLVAMALDDLLAARGCAVIGPASSVAEALVLLERESPAAALLDVNLGDETSAEVARALAARGKPFLVVTGYEELAAVEPSLAHAPRLVKPAAPELLIATMKRLFC
jgi:DNA-binding NarL/FixJ family response regulator